MSEQKSVIHLIKSSNNMFLEEIKKCKKNGYKTYVYGAGEGAENVEKRAASIGIRFDGRVVDQKYYKAGSDCESLESVVSSEVINLVVAHRGYTPSKLDSIRDHIGIVVDRDCFAGNYEADPEMMTFDFVRIHDREISQVYNSLADDKSREVFLAYIEQKISMDYTFLESLGSRVQYFDPELITLHENEALVDAGAYIGDTASSFVEQLKKYNLDKSFSIYSFEPDERNYEKLKNNSINGMEVYNIATSDKTGTVGFSSVGKGSSSGIQMNNSEGTIHTDTIDNVLKGKNVTFIKMDVEGYELESLRGAEETIRSMKPNLAICIYHKRSDLWTIFDYIHSIVKEYRFFVRIYEKTATELVLYAIR